MDRLKLVESDAPSDVRAMMLQLGEAARAAQRRLATSTDAARSTALRAAALALRDRRTAILDANVRDMAEGVRRGLSPASLDRLKLDPSRIDAMAHAIEEIAALPDPVGRMLARYERPNGLVIERVATPLGVIGVIYESRPNVTADAGALCLKAGNACILRGGSESFWSSMAIHECLLEGLAAAELPAAAITLVPTRDRDAVGAMLSGLRGNIDVLVPRGGKALVGRVEAEARVPVFAHLEGLVHLFIDRDADLERARAIVLNSKLRRTGVCGAVETLLIDQAVAATHLAPLVTALIDAGCEVRGDATTQAADPRVVAATEEDWRTEYLDRIIACRVVDGLEAAIDHIASYGSHHTDGIVTENLETAEAFLARVDSAIVVHNASTQFADGGEFGFGGEIGIATGRMHARGPVGVEQLTSFNYRVRGTGQTRP
ncbi:glutamate-5-semialdehyde dehydrogenase [Lichenifustis flavocetrariae]|uniref:Gamma-glutamyl phosphate reductase n=1 Tax=Lichenifustis flavocetrariae TaxID=2949735 RepID=A0AA42CL49_9HYPH|nr:glutamate-5-semialdehyde dehydrogenase [Lichenifustis flavocetrariae]MCW6507022.1 glutamate-5-semialdehyde dehydrogenase [Lichenifustis flavocetrariae]